ncbi:hypothetical protein WDU94_007832, partial [Cyamophila willieti]
FTLRTILKRKLRTLSIFSITPETKLLIAEKWEPCLDFWEAVQRRADIQEIIVTCENPEFGNIALSRFLPIVSGMISENRFQPASAEELLKAFRTLDKENKNYLDKEYLTKLMMEEGEPFTPEEIEEMMTTAVDQDTGRIPYEYYINHIMVRNSLDK